MTAQSVIIAKAQIVLLREEIDARLIEAQATLSEMAATAATPKDAARLTAKSKGADYVRRYHVPTILTFEGPTEVLLYVREVEGGILDGGYEAGFVEGADLVFAYIRGYLR